MTATVETVSEQLDLAAIIPSEKVVCAVARSVTLSETDVATATVHVAKPQIVGENEQPVEPGPDDDLEDFWHTSIGKFRFSLEDLPQPLQYIHQLLQELPKTEKPDVLYYMLQCLNILILNGDAFTKAAKDHRGFFIWCQENLLIKNLWELCNAEHSHICEVCVPVLLHCITLPLGSDVFWRVIQEEFHNPDWRVRFVAVERVTVITRFMDYTPLKNVVPLQAALANALCYLISSMDDSNVYIAQRATLYLGTIHDNAVKSLLLCLETQFDSVIVDRPMVLQSLYQLHNSLSDRKVLTWEFFLNRFDALFLEAQINLEKTGDISYLRDLRNSEVNSELFINKLRRAHEALSQSDGSGCGSVKTLSASFGTKWPYKRTMSAPASIIPRADTKMGKPEEKEKVYNRQYSAPILKRKSSRFGLGQLLGSNQPSHATPSNNTSHTNVSNTVNNTIPVSATDGHIHSIGGAGDENNLMGFLHRVIDFEEADRETMHLLVFLFMQFLSRADQAYPSEEKYMAKTQSIVLRHLYLLLGYNLSERVFHTPPNKLRTSAVFNVFLSNLPQLFDQNHLMGLTLVPTAMSLLLYCPSPQQSTGTDVMPTFGLWYLEPHARRNWLMSLLVLLYKYQYNQQPQAVQLQSLIRIVLNTLDAQNHVCRSYPSTVMMPPNRSRDVSQPSLGTDMGDHASGADKFETPPLSPMYTGDSSSHVTVSTKGKVQAVFHQKSAPGMETHWEETVQPKGMRTYQGSSIEADETESELVGIPESDKSDSTLHGSSAPGSFDDPIHFDELCLPLKPEIMRGKATAQMTTENLASTHVAVSSAFATSHQQTMEDTRKVTSADNYLQPDINKKPLWFMGSDEANLQQKPSGPKCSVHEGVKMMVTSSMLSQQKSAQFSAVITQQPVAVQRPTVVTQPLQPNHKPSARNVSQPIVNPPCQVKHLNEKAPEKEVCKTNGTQIKHVQPQVQVAETVKVGIPTPGKLATNGATATNGSNWPEYPRHGSPIPKPLGRQKRIVEPSITPACTPVSAPRTGGTSPVQSIDSAYIASSTWFDLPGAVARAAQSTSTVTTPADRLLPIGASRTPANKSSPRYIKSESANYASPESPLSKMDIMTVGSPGDDVPNSELLSPRSISQLEMPIPERLLPIGQHGKEGITYLVEKVREALGMAQEQEKETPTSGESKPFSYLKQESFDKSETQSVSPQPHVTIPREDTMSSRGASPRRLIKQVALESPPPTAQDPETDELHSVFFKAAHFNEKKIGGKHDEHIRNQRQRLRKVGPFTIGSHSISDAHTHKRPGSWYGTQRDNSVLDEEAQQACHAAFDMKQSSFRIGEDCVVERCSLCGAVKEEYSDEELGLCIIILGTFIHREPALAAPFLPEILNVVSMVALNPMYPWQNESNIHLPGGATSVAHQFLRCVLHQLAPNGVFVQMFQTQSSEKSKMQFFKSVAHALLDFNELNPIGPLQMLAESLNSKKTLPVDQLPIILHNMACYLECLPLEAGLGPGTGSSIWGALLGQLETLFRRIALLLSSLEDIIPLMRIMISVLKIPGISQFKGILDPFSKILSFSIQNFALKYQYLVDLCYLCNRGFSKERDKLLICRMIVFELVQALKFKTSLPDSNFLLLINFILQDAGGSLPLSVVMENTAPLCPDSPSLFTANVSDCMRQYMNDIVEFLNDFHTLSKIKSYSKGVTVGLNEDTLGGVIKGGVAQYVAIEITRGNRDNRAVTRYLPWLYTAPGTQQTQREFTECIGHVRLLSWLLLGSLTHTALHGTNQALHGNHHSASHVVAQPIPQDTSCHIADHIQHIMTGFAEQSKASVLHMSSLFHAFILCQLWTVYLEQNSCTNANLADPYNTTMCILFDFWGKITPSILQLASHSKVLAEMVNLHFMSLLEALLECRCTLLSKLLPILSPILYSHNVQLPGHLQTRLEACRNLAPTASPDDNYHAVLLKWLQRLQFKMGQIELQSSTATQFYSI